MREIARHLRELIVASDDYRRTVAASLDVSTNEAAVLGELLHEGALTAGSITARTGLTPASTTALIDRLVSAGLVERSTHPDDRRRVLVRLTAPGRAAIESMFSLFASDLDEALLQFEPRLADDPDLREALSDMLRTMASSLRTHASDQARAVSVVSAATARHAPHDPTSQRP